jgi:hypothetical protein
VVNDSGDARLEMNYGGAAGNAVRASLDDGARLPRTPFNAVLIAVGTNLIIAFLTGGRHGGLAEVAEHFFGDKTNDKFEFAGIHGSRSCSARS